MAIEAVFLDVGGTLMTEHPPRAEVYAEAGRARGIDVDERRAGELMHRIARALPREVDGDFRYSEGWFGHLIERMFVGELGMDRAELSGLRGEFFARFADPASFQLYPGALELLDSLANHGLAVGIVSNWSERLPQLLEGLGVAQRVDFILVSANERSEKPEAEFFRLALERTAIAPARTVHAGNDLAMDVRGARDCGILPVLVDHNERQNPPRKDAVARVTDLFQLERWISERTAR